jgi:acyl carrier protein
MTTITTRRVVKIACDQFVYGNDDKSWVNGETTWDDLGMDSLDKVEFVIAVEEEFEIDIPDEELDKLQSIRDVVDYIEVVTAA